MSRSIRKNPVVPVCKSTISKIYKQISNRAFRRTPIDAEIPKKQEFGNEWMGPRDGKMYVKNPESKLLRK